MIHSRTFPRNRGMLAKAQNLQRFVRLQQFLPYPDCKMNSINHICINLECSQLSAGILGLISMRLLWFRIIKGPPLTAYLRVLWSLMWHPRQLLHSTIHRKNITNKSNFYCESLDVHNSFCSSCSHKFLSKIVSSAPDIFLFLISANHTCHWKTSNLLLGFAEILKPVLLKH